MAEPLLSAPLPDITSSTFVAKNMRTPTNSSVLPNSTSSDYDAMFPYWDMVRHIIGGTAAMRAAGAAYLPQFPLEDPKDWKYRLANSVFTNIYADIVNNLAAKPFAEECKVDEAATQQFKDLAENIDGRGNSLHVFAGETFFWGVNNAIDWILIDFPKAQKANPNQVLTIADEKAQGLRPYWIHIPAINMIAVYSNTVNGQEIFVHARMSEIVKERNGFSEMTIERVRVFNREPILNEFMRIVGYSPATYELWEKVQKSGVTNSDTAWRIVEEGPVTIGVIPIVPFITGKRLGASWQFIPVMRDCAYAQIEHYQAETSLKSIKELTAFPMLSGNGVNPPGNKEPKIRVGPRIVLYAPPTAQTGSGHGSWTYVEPNGTSLTFLAKEIERIEQQMRELGRQPLTANTGNLTVVTTAFAAQKGNSAVQQWALNLKDALEQAFVITAKWLNQSDGPTVFVYDDFALDMNDDKSQEWIMDMAKRGRISQQTEWEEAQRRSVLSADFDPEEESKRIASEAPPPPTAADMAAALAGGGNPKTKPAPIKKPPIIGS